MKKRLRILRTALFGAFGRVKIHFFRPFRPLRPMVLILMCGPLKL